MIPKYFGKQARNADMCSWAPTLFYSTQLNHYPNCNGPVFRFQLSCFMVSDSKKNPSSLNHTSLPLNFWFRNPARNQYPGPFFSVKQQSPLHKYFA